VRDDNQEPVQRSEGNEQEHAALRPPYERDKKRNAQCHRQSDRCPTLDEQYHQRETGRDRNRSEAKLGWPRQLRGSKTYRHAQ
jgi:hypothetical protein